MYEKFIEARLNGGEASSWTIHQETGVDIKEAVNAVHALKRVKDTDLWHETIKLEKSCGSGIDGHT